MSDKRKELAELEKFLGNSERWPALRYCLAIDHEDGVDTDQLWRDLLRVHPEECKSDVVLPVDLARLELLTLLREPK